MLRQIVLTKKKKKPETKVSECPKTPPAVLLLQVRVQARTDSSRSYDSRSSSTISSDVAGVNRPLPPPVALKPTAHRPSHPSEERRPGDEDPANTSFQGKVSSIVPPLHWKTKQVTRETDSWSEL